MKTHPTIEHLEARIAPANLVTINAATKTATWTDFDGDLVTLKWTGATSPDFAATAPPHGVAGSARIDSITLHNVNDAITVTVKASAADVSDGHVDLGYINATGLPVKSFTATHASVLEFDCGDGTSAIGAFSIASYGTLRQTAFSNPGGEATGVFNGAVGSFKITGDLDYGSIQLGGDGSARTNNKIGTVTVGGSLHGDTSQMMTAGDLTTDGPAGAIKIGGSLIGGLQNNSGSLFVYNSATNVTIGGDIVGGPGVEAGQVNLGLITGAVTVGGSVIGGSGDQSGVMFLGSFGTVPLKSLAIGGNVQGGAVENSGFVRFYAGAGSVTVKGSVIGGSVTNPTNASSSAGAIEVTGDVTSLTIGHNLVAGTTTNSGGNTTHLDKNGAVLVDGTLGSFTVNGSIEGNNLTRAYVVAKGTTPAIAGKSFNGIGKITVKGSVSYAIIASGQSAVDADFSTNLGAAENPDAGIGAVTIGGDYYHTSLLAGTNDVGIRRGVDASDTQSQGDANRTANLGVVTIKGALLDDTDSAGFSGFEAEAIAKIVVGGNTIFTHNPAPPAIRHIAYLDTYHDILAQEIPT